MVCAEKELIQTRFDAENQLGEHRFVLRPH